jgi:hypothetical protein
MIRVEGRNGGNRRRDDGNSDLHYIGCCWGLLEGLIRTTIDHGGLMFDVFDGDAYSVSDE